MIKTKQLSSFGMDLLVLLLLTIAMPAMAQTGKVMGTVTSADDGKAISYVSVRNLTTRVAVVADEKGHFSIVAKPNEQLSFSALGFEAQTVTVISGKANYVVALKLSSSSTLNEVVVIGYGEVQRKDLTGSVGSVDMQDFEKAPVKSFDDALAGRVAGVVVQNGDGQPGSNANIVIRGAGSITQDQSPLYVVDGFPMEDANANSIAPADIENIDILKDASATAIYGARGANGVVLITTKRGKSGAPVLTYNGYYGIQSEPGKVEMMDPYEFVKMVHDLNPAYDSTYLQPPVVLDDYRNAAAVDMQEKVFRTGSNQNHDLAVRGGNADTKYSLSLNYNNQNGIIINTSFKRYQGRFSLDQNVGSRLKVGINTNFSYAANYGPQVAATNFYASSNILYSVWGWRPTNPLSGSYADIDLENDFYDALSDATGNQDYRVNPYTNLQNMQRTNAVTTFVTNAYAEYKVSKKLKLRISGGVTQPVTNVTYFNDTLTQSGSKWNATGVNGGVSTAKATNWLNENTLTYSNTFKKDHNFTAVIGASIQGQNSFYNGFSANQLPNPELGIDGLDLAAKENVTPTIYSSSWRMISGIARFNYDYKKKYLLTASMRADGSSKFAKDQRWGYFPSAAFAWSFNKEAFAEKWELLSSGKLRIGVGASGNNRVSDFAYLATLNLTNLGYSYSWNDQTPQYGAVINTAGNSDLKWETSVQTNLGLDLGFWKDRLVLTIDVYQRDVNNLLLNASLPYANGIPSATGYKNVGQLTNKGLEFSLSTVNVKNRDFSWTSNFNIAFNKNQINALTEGQNSLLSGSGTFFNTTYSSLSPYISVVGRPLGEMYGLIWEGVYQHSDFDLMPNGTYVLKNGIPDNGTSRANVRPGDIKYQDINGDGTVNTQDWTIIGSGLPKYTGGLSNNFTYRNFDLSVLLQWSVGNDVINANRYIFEGGIVTNPNVNQYADYANRWTPENPSNEMFRAGGFGNAAYSSRVIEDGSYLKLRTVSLGYTISPKVLRRAKLSNTRVYASAQNLLTWTAYSGLDPESSSRQSNLTPGFDYASYPHSLNIVFGANITF